MRSTLFRALALLLVLVLAMAACGNSEQSGSSDGGGGDDGGEDDGGGDGGGGGGDGDTSEFIPSDQPGVTDDEIRVAGLTSATNQLGGNYADAYDGVNAYFEMINSEGGIYGRDLVVATQHDDAILNNQTEVQAILAQDDVFAVLPVASILFSGAPDLADAGMPTFGWNIQEDWQAGPSLFGEKGSYICPECPGAFGPWLTEEIGAEKVAVLGYNTAPQSIAAAAGFRDSYEEFGGGEVVFFDDSLPYGVPDLSGEVAEMKANGVDLVRTAMDQNGVRTLQLEMDRQDLDAVQVLANAYDPAFVEEFGELFEGSYVLIEFWPFEEETNQPEGMKNYLKWMEKTGGNVNEISMAGWLSADLFVTGLTAAGPEFTQQSVVDAINAMTDWDANGLTPGVDWTIGHDQDQPLDCFAVMKLTADGYERAFGEDGKPFTCLDESAEEIPEPEFRS
jgi:ABC-type branched-subunit amino acid transport system substrate-binding protein